MYYRVTNILCVGKKPARLHASGATCRRAATIALFTALVTVSVCSAARTANADTTPTGNQFDAEKTNKEPPTVNDAPDSKEDDIPPEFLEEENQEGPPEKEGWVDKTHKSISKSVEATISAIDRFFSTEQYASDATESFLRLRPEYEYDTQDKSDVDFKINAKIDLPNTKKRLRILISSDSDTLGQDDRFANTDDSNNQGAIAIERASRKPRTKWNVRPAVGIKGTWPLDPFAQVRATRYYEISPKWLSRLQGTTRYLLDDKWDLRTELDFNRLIEERWAFRVRTDLRWREAKETTEANQFFTFYHLYSDKIAVAYDFGIFTDDDPKWDVDRYRYMVAWRKLVYKDWLFFEVRPEIAFKEKNDYDASGSIQLRLEALFGRGRLKKIKRGLNL